MTRERAIDALPYVTIVTAAGQGQRMGGPKALLAVRWGEGPGELPLAIAHARAHLDGGAERVVVVTRPEVARTLSRFQHRGLEIVVSNQGAELGPAGSIRCALEYLDLDPEAWLLIAPVDAPPISQAIRRELLDKAQDPAVRAVRPVYDGKRGHPVLVRRKHLEPFFDEPTPTLRDVLAALGDAVVDVEVEDRRAVVDFAEPADVKAFYGTPARFFVEDEPSLG
jgi:CTP:molybdopterin cytidylyltransferase MocA